MKKLMSILLAAAMLIAVFAGCTADKKDDERIGKKGSERI